MVISDKERSKIWYRKQRIKAKKKHREVRLQRRAPIIWIIEKIIDAFKFKKNYIKKPYSKRRNQKYKVVKDE